MIKQSMRGSTGAAKLNKKLPKICLGHLANSNNHRTSCFYELSNFAKEQTAILFPVALLFLSISD